MKADDNKTTEKKDAISPKNELIKSISIVLSSIVISLTGTLLTYKYNSNQLIITKTKELTVLLPQLRSTDPNEQMQSIIGLSLYGKDAIQPLISVWGHSGDLTINAEVLNSILIIGKVAIPELLAVYNNRYENMTKRQWAFLALIRLNYEGAAQLIRDALYANNFDDGIVSTAMLGVGDLKLLDLSSKVLQISRKFRPAEGFDVLKKNTMHALKLLGGPEVKNELMEYLKNQNPEIRKEAVISVMEIGDTQDIPLLLQIKASDVNETVREWADYAIDVIEIRFGI